jgi:glycosyltransferase involved in cell wall biosynthesis
MKFALILMIKNEEKILLRCLKALENVIEYFCICDTGSTDKTLEIAKEFLETHKGCLTEEPFQNFGYNRSVSFNNAQKYLDESKVNLKETYGLLLDADMILEIKNFNKRCSCCLYKCCIWRFYHKTSKSCN